MQSAENEFGALHEWINKHLSDDLSLAMRRNFLNYRQA